MNTTGIQQARNILERAHKARGIVSSNWQQLRVKRAAVDAARTDASQTKASADGNADALDKVAKLEARTGDIEAEIAKIENSNEYKSAIATLREAADFVPGAFADAEEATIARYIELVKPLESELLKARNLILASTAASEFRKKIHQPICTIDDDPVTAGGLAIGLIEEALHRQETSHALLSAAF